MKLKVEGEQSLLDLIKILEENDRPYKIIITGLDKEWLKMYEYRLEHEVTIYKARVKKESK